MPFCLSSYFLDRTRNICPMGQSKGLCLSAQSNRLPQKPRTCGSPCGREYIWEDRKFAKWKNKEHQSSRNFITGEELTPLSEILSALFHQLNPEQ